MALTLPTPGGSNGTWGIELNDALADLEAAKVDRDVDGKVAEADLPDRLGETALSATIRAEAAPKITPSIDLCRVYDVHPGDDITQAVQDAINTLASAGQSGEIYVSEVGTYLINGAQQTGTALTYSYSGQILFPAVNFDGVPGLAITIRGPVRPSSGVDTTGAPQGVIFQSNATTGWVFDCVPAQAKWEWQWTGIMPIFENVIVRGPSNPTCGGINLECALRTKLDGVSVDTVPPGWVFPTGTREAVVLPHYYNNGDVTMRDVNIRGFPGGSKLSEHCVLDNVNVIACAAAFTGTGGGHANYFSYVDVEECPTIFQIATIAGHGLLMYGYIDIENTYTTGPFAANTLVNGTGFISGKLDLSVTGAGPYTPGNLASISRNLDLGNPGQGNGTTWMEKHPVDTFQRLQNIGIAASALAPGLANPTLHPWKSKQGTWTVTAASRLKSTVAGNALALVPARHGGESRSVQATFNLGAAGYWGSVVACRPYDNDVAAWARLRNDQLQVGIGSTAATPTGTFATINSVVTASTTHTVKLEMFYLNDAPHLMRVYVDGVLKVSHTLTAAEKTSLARTTVFPYMEDGVQTGTTDTEVTKFEVKDITPLPASMSSGTATLVAGTVTVADTQVTASSVVRLSRQAAGGALGQLSVALTAGTSFTINSSSATDTSTVYYEVVSY